MFGTLSHEEIEAMLRKQYVCRIGCYAEGRIYVVPLSYAYDGEYIYCHTQEGMKTRMMRENPGVCFEIDSLESGPTWKSVILWGRFEEVTGKKERSNALKILLHRVYPFIISKKMQLGRDWPFEPEDLNDIEGVVFRVNIEEMTGRYEVNDESWHINSKIKG
ncbi:MAG: pyridoxamine 5'-phosphate oxidase family protein [Bacteroidetes bacterium]|nr:pyridoxamine 5'-phosphate oxidase family protein [Bacteroidota bacterium]MBS1973434.1 pyridoxamine 5'-phosphate oxidase family protein [Bacteroidota bacterium]